MHGSLMLMGAPTLYLTIHMVEFFEIFIMLIHHTTRSYGYMLHKVCFSIDLVVVLEMTILEHFW